MMTCSQSEARASGGSYVVTGSGQDAEAGGDSDAAADQGLGTAVDGDPAAQEEMDVLVVDGSDAVAAEGNLDSVAGGDSTADGDSELQPDAISLEVTTHLSRGVKRNVSWAMLDLPIPAWYPSTAYQYCRYALYISPSCPLKRQRTTGSSAANNLVPATYCSLAVRGYGSRMPFAVTACSLVTGRTGCPDDGTSDCAVGNGSDEDCEARSITSEVISEDCRSDSRAREQDGKHDYCSMTDAAAGRDVDVFACGESDAQAGGDLNLMVVAGSDLMTDGDVTVGGDSTADCDSVAAARGGTKTVATDGLVAMASDGSDVVAGDVSDSMVCGSWEAVASAGPDAVAGGSDAVADGGSGVVISGGPMASYGWAAVTVLWQVVTWRRWSAAALML